MTTRDTMSIISDQPQKPKETAMLVEFHRPDDKGNLTVNPETVGAVSRSVSEPGQTLIRLKNGPAYFVTEGYDQVIDMLAGHSSSSLPSGGVEIDDDDGDDY